MKTQARMPYWIIVLVLILVGMNTHAWDASAQAQGLDYPSARRVDHVDTYHSVDVADPYRWMEEMDSDEVKAWAKAQDALTKRFVSEVPLREAIEKRIAEIGRFDSYGMPNRKGGRYFFTRSEAGKGQSMVYVQENLEAEPRVVLDPYTLFEDEELRFGGFTPSPDGRLITYRMAKNQSRWGAVQVMNVDSGEILPDRVAGLRTNTTVWTKDSEGFFYAHYGDLEALEAGTVEPFAQVYYHRLGTDQAEDVLVYDRPDKPEWVYGIWLSDDGRYLLLPQSVPSGSNNRLFYKEVNNLEDLAETLIGDFDASYTFLGNDGTLFWFQTNQDAPHGRVVGIDLTTPQPEHWVALIPEREETLNSVSLIGDRFIVRYLKDAREQVKVFDTQGRFQYDLEVPNLGGRLTGFSGDRTLSETFYGVRGLYEPGVVYRLDVERSESTFFRRFPLNFNPDDFVTKQVFYESKDGTRVPMFVVHKKGLPLDGSHPAFMYAFGSGGWAAFLWFQPHMIAWLEMGGVYALPNIRGGGEYGTAWMEAGVRKNKQNTIDDYVAAAEWLIENGYTSPSKMVANGGSASGLLPAAAILQRPDLFGAGVIDIPFLDMLRYHEFTLFSGWRNAFGVSTDPEEFEALYAYSPYHNVQAGTCYPPMLISIGEKDRGAVPMHGYKFAAAMQAAQGCDNPALLKVIWDTGHSYGSSSEQTRETYADQLAFLIRTLHLEAPAAFRRAQAAYAAPAEDVEAVRQAVLDYVEGLYLIDPSRIERSVSPGLAKLGVGEGSESPSQITDHRMSYETLLDLAANWNKDGSEAAPDAVKEVVIYEVLDYTASVKLIATWGIDYLHLAKYDGRWMIMNVLYQSHPGREGE